MDEVEVLNGDGQPVGWEPSPVTEDYTQVALRDLASDQLTTEETIAKIQSREKFLVGGIMFLGFVVLTQVRLTQMCLKGMNQMGAMLAQIQQASQPGTGPQVPVQAPVSDPGASPAETVSSSDLIQTDGTIFDPGPQEPTGEAPVPPPVDPHSDGPLT